jgi:Flp pilus assembly protein CpaB
VEFAGNLLSSRRGTILVGAAAAVLAAILLVVYLNRYRASLNGSAEPATVLVAKSLIQKGAPGNLVGSTHQFQVASIPKDQLKDGALTDPGALAGLVAAKNIYPGQQLTLAEFTPTVPGSLQTNLTKRDRAISIPFDSSHGMVGQISPGDHVDVYVGLNQAGPGGAVPIIKRLIDNTLVLATPGAGASSGNIILRAKGPQAAELAFAADNGKLWLVLRPASGARPVNPGLVTAGRLLLGVRPVR